MDYDIRINEEQRQIIEDALFATRKVGGEEKFELWQMFSELPREEHASPSALHDFTL